MELLNEGPESEQVARVMLECVVTVPTQALDWLLPALRRGGIEAHDTHERGSDEEGIGTIAEVRLRVPS